MPKPRRKDQIRQAAHSKVQALNCERGEVRERDWRAIALDAILHGSTITAAARLAGVTRHRLYNETWRCPLFERAFQLARHYGYNRIIWVSRPIWPPSAETVQRHDATFRRIYGAPRCELVGPDKWR